MRRPYRAEHVGSLPRPDRLITAREDFAAGKIAITTQELMDERDEVRTLGLIGA